MPRQTMKSAVQTLLENGFAVPPELHRLAAIKDYEQRGVVQVWKCRSKVKKADGNQYPCPFVYEAPIPISSVECPTHGTLCRKTYPLG